MNRIVDLYDIYKKVKQRATRCSNPSQKILANGSVDAILQVLEDPCSKSANNFILKEIEWANHQNTRPSAVLYGEIIYASIIGNYYTINKPHYKTRALGEDPNIGVFYAASSLRKPEQIKIGYTTRKIEERLRKYKQKYGYELELKLNINCQYPARIEEMVSKEISGLRVSGCTQGDSNEWYYTRIEDVKSIAISLCKKNNYNYKCIPV